MVALRVDREPTGFRVLRQGRKLRVMFQRRFRRISDKAAIRANGQDLIKGLVGCDLTGLPRLTGIGGVNVDHHTTKGGVTVADDLAETEFRDSFPGHEATVTDLT